jgi:hypothetical protein
MDSHFEVLKTTARSQLSQGAPTAAYTVSPSPEMFWYYQSDALPEDFQESQK